MRRNLTFADVDLEGRLRQLHKAEQEYEKKLNSLKVNLVGIVGRAACTTSTPATHTRIGAP
jgi:hypothetical protein